MKKPTKNLNIADFGKRAAYSPGEFAQLAGVGTATVSRRIADGSLPTVKLGGRRLIPGSFVEKLYAGGEV